MRKTYEINGLDNFELDDLYYEIQDEINKVKGYIAMSEEFKAIAPITEEGLKELKKYINELEEKLNEIDNITGIGD